MASEGFFHEMRLFFSADSLSEADRLSKKEEKFPQENSFFIFMSVSNQISFFLQTYLNLYIHVSTVPCQITALGTVHLRQRRV